MTTTISKDLLLMKDGNVSDAEHGHSAPNTQRTKRRQGLKLSNRRTIHVSSYCGLLGTLFVRREVRHWASRDQKGYSEETCSWSEDA